MKMKKLSLTFLLLLSLPTIYGCAPSVPPPPPLTQLQIRELQTREFETRDYKLVMKAMLNVLQDEGFIVKNAVVELGLLTATKELEVERYSGSGFPRGSIFSGGIGSDPWGRRRYQGGFNWGVLADLGNNDRVYSKNSVIEASANVSDFGNVTRVRINFQKKVIDNYGATVDVFQITDPQFYQEFFSRVDKGIFIQKERL